MAAQKVRTSPARVTIPQLSEKAIRQRATRAFDRSVQALIYQYFYAMPPKEDMDHLRTILQRTDPNADIYTRLERAMRTFRRDRPNSDITRYYNFSLSVGFLVVGTGSRARLAFNAKELGQDVRRRLEILGSIVADTILSLSRPGYLVSSHTVETAAYGMDREMLRQFRTNLENYLGARGSSLPFDISLDRAGNLVVSRATRRSAEVARR